MSEAEVLEPSTELVPIEDLTALAAAVEKQPGIVLLDREKFNAWYERLAAEAPRDVDVNTHKGREKLRSYAAKVRSEKASIDKARLKMTEDWRDMVKQANAAGAEIRDQLESLAVDVRKPLTEWEEAEKAREAEAERIISLFRSSRFVAMGESADSIRERGTLVHKIQIEADLFQDRAEEATREKKDTVEHLFAALKAAEQAEADRAELERLQREAAERVAAEEEKRLAEEAEARRIEQERIAEEQRAAAEKAEQERIAAAEREAEDRARREAEEAAEAERQRAAREHEEALAAERRRAEQAEADAQAERDRIAAAEQERKAEAQRQADEKAAREADEQHRTNVKAAAKKAIMTAGVAEDAARKIVVMIIAGEVPAVRLEF